MRGMIATADGFGQRTVPVRPLDEEQARLLEILTAADGGPLSLDALRAHGIENPATLAYELEIAGLPIAQVHEPSAGGLCLQLGVQLDPSQVTPDRGDVPAQPGADGESAGSGTGRRVGAWTVAAVAAGLALVALAVGLSGALSGATAKDGHGREAGSVTRHAAVQGPAAAVAAAGSGKGRTNPAGARTSAGKGSSKSSANGAGTAGGSELQSVHSQLRAPRRHPGSKPTTTGHRPHRTASTLAQPGGTSAPAPDASRAGRPSRKASPERKPGATGGHGTTGGHGPSGGQRSGSQPNHTSSNGGRQTPGTSPAPGAQRHTPSATQSPSGESQAPSGGQPAATGGQEAPSGHTNGQSG